MKASEIRNLSAKELDAKLLELKDELFKLRFQQAINQLENPMRISAVKKDIARVKTVIRDIELHGKERGDMPVGGYGIFTLKDARDVFAAAFQ